jgi:hypothetical protein
VQIATATLNPNGYGAAYADFAVSSLSAGNHSLKVVYGGDANFQGSTASLTEVINAVQTPTTTYLNSSAPTANAGTPISFTVYEFAGPTLSPPGNVSLFDGNTLLATVPLNIPAAGQTYATYTTSALAAGNHTIRAVYGGDANFQGSTASLTEVINAVQTPTAPVPTTTYIASSALTANAGTPVSFTVREYANAALSPSGNVSLFDGNTLLVTLGLNAAGQGQSNASWTTSSLAAGNHTIRAVYGGDANFQGSTASLTEVINAASQPVFACADLTAYRPQETSCSYSPFAKTAVPDQYECDPQRGPGIRIDGDKNNANLVEVDINVTGVNYILQRGDTNLRVWASANKGSEIVFTNNQSSSLTSSLGSSVARAVWVEWVGDRQGTSTLTLKPASGTGPQDSLLFHTFHSIVISIGGETFGNNAQPNPSSSIWQVGSRLYDEGYDVYLHNEDDVAMDGSGAAYNEVYNAVHNEGVTQVAIFGYSHGGGDTYYLANRLNSDGTKIGTFTIAFTAYVDAIANDRLFLGNYDPNAEIRRPPGSAYHMNYYRSSGIWSTSEGGLHGQPTQSSRATDFQLDVLTTTKNATHSTGSTSIDVLAQVQTGIHDGLVTHVIA